MKTLLFYLLQVIVTSGILYGYYHIALKNKRFHWYNRFYLLTATLLSIAVPFLNIPVYFAQSATESSFVLETLTVISSAGADNSALVIANHPSHNSWFTWENISWLFYILIASIVLLRIIFSLLKIRRIVRHNPVEQLDKIHFVNTDEPGTPFSFFRWLFWNKKIELHSEKGEQIFRHELFHIEQKHSWDTIFMELLTVVFWINPFFYLMKKELKAIHEFLADQFAISENTKWQYAELLLMQALNTNQHLVNPFFHNQIKRRIAMITTSKKPGHQYLRKIMVLPVAAIVLALFAFKYKERQADKNNQPSEMLQVFSDTIKPIDTDNKIFDRVEIEPSFPGGAALWRKYLERNLDVSIPIKKKAPDGTYTVIVQFIVDKEGNISDAKALTNHRYGMEEEAIRIIKSGPGWTPALQNGRVAKAYRKQPITFIVGKGDKIISSNEETAGYQLNNYKNSLLVKDGKIIGRIKGDNWNIALEDFVRVNILDENEAMKKYGESGKNGAKEVYTLKSKPEDYKNDTLKPGRGIAQRVFDKVEIPPHFPGGDTAWRRYLQRNANALLPVDSGAPAGIYKVIVQFIVQEDGLISEIKSTTSHGYGMEKEAMRLIKNGPPWVPAKQNGRNVGAYVQQPVTFQVEEESESLETLNDIVLPVENAILKIPFGKYNIGSISTNNPGITLSAAKGSKVRAMQNGEISGVYQLGNFMAVTIRAGNYFTTYSGLKNVKFMKGEKVGKGNILGEVSIEKNYELDFIVMERTKTIDPITWLKNQ